MVNQQFIVFMSKRPIGQSSKRVYIEGFDSMKKLL
jgi:hypothetical protein